MLVRQIPVRFHTDEEQQVRKHAKHFANGNMAAYIREAIRRRLADEAETVAKIEEVMRAHEAETTQDTQDPS